MHQLPKANQNNGLILLCGLQNRLCKSGFRKQVIPCPAPLFPEYIRLLLKLPQYWQTQRLPSPFTLPENIVLSVLCNQVDLNLPLCIRIRSPPTANRFLLSRYSLQAFSKTAPI